jgi:hypothetical protein
MRRFNFNVAAPSGELAAYAEGVDAAGVSAHAASSVDLRLITDTSRLIGWAKRSRPALTEIYG